MVLMIDQENITLKLVIAHLTNLIKNKKDEIVKKTLTKLQAYNTMSKLLIIYYDLYPADDIGIIGGSMSFLENKRTVDDAMWINWIKSLDLTVKHKKLRNYNHLTLLQSFLAMGIFLENYFGVNNLAKDIKFLKENIKLAAEHKKVDPLL